MIHLSSVTRSQAGPQSPSWADDDAQEPGVLNAAREAAAQYVTFDSNERSLRLTRQFVESAARAGLDRVPELKSASFEVRESALDLRLRREDGVEVHALIEPTLLELWSDRVRVSARIPGGIRATHQNAVKAFFVGFLDRVLGLVKERVQSVPGLSLDEESLVYERVLDKPLPLVSLLGIDTARVRSFPLRIREHALVVELGDAFPRERLGRQ